MSTLIKVNQLRKTYGKGEKAFHAVDGISFELEQGEFIAVMGPSGSGKSTLLNLLSTIDRPTEGDIIVEGANLSAMTEKDLADFRQKNLALFFKNTTCSIPLPWKRISCFLWQFRKQLLRL